MNKRILHKEVQDFIFEKSNKKVDPHKLALSGSPFKEITPQELAQQVNGRIKAEHKLKSWFSQRDIYYPPTINLEQTSSETTALYKSNLVSGKVLIDLTGGLGIDDYFFSKKTQKVIHCELNSELSDIAKHNFTVLTINNIETHSGDGLTLLKDQNTVDWIYIDPSRRNESKGKVFFLEDCLPDVPKHLDFLFSKSGNIMIKTSPLLDIQAGIKSLKKIKEIHVIAVNNEVKELLWILDSSYVGNITIKTANITKDNTQGFTFLLKDETIHIANLGLPKKYLYEPNAAILKSGGFSSISKHFDLDKLHLHSHLYTSDNEIDFPGRKFEIITVFPYQKKVLAKTGITKANITTRNFPESVAGIRKKFKIKDGGDHYLFFTTDCKQNKVVIQCKKVF
ncbi:THUMP-like domain-containing protein [Aquimarina sp. 2201CG5-10]|uniref:THUMP-like domain-containing protein n=1 Tax=Aquimarina callyspongiae TaxID=3098150 RepID=UPI002AB46217|nr:class I SAM-dependent methyltransferase [Aquimarina sp. 2201CG5-10]MDY8138426.1 class I SAM-dependent methyltransferase [Aquimarina sp. 2201CG5-10]